MDILQTYHDNLVNQVEDTFYRYLMHEINWDQKMIAIKGPRRSGKTTLMLQYIRYFLKKPREQVLYISADHYWFYTHNLVETADEFYKYGGRYLFIDEVHKYPRWSRELKNIYDGYPEMRIVFTSSSALEIFKGEADLSRRVLTYDLPGLSFREYLVLNGHDLPHALSVDDILLNHNEIAGSILQKVQPLPHFKKYLRSGYLPIFMEDPDQVIDVKLNQIINTIIDSDLAGIEDYNSGTAFKVKQLLGVLAESVPFKPNVSAIARKLEVSRESIYAWLTHLEKAKLINMLQSEGKGISTLQKPEKLYLENTNLMFELKPQPETGNIRETFLLSQLKNKNLEVRLPQRGNFLINGLHIEVGGKSKNSKQVNLEEKYIIAMDDIEIGFKHKIPLWIFGLLY